MQETSFAAMPAGEGQEAAPATEVAQVGYMFLHADDAPRPGVRHHYGMYFGKSPLTALFLATGPVLCRAQLLDQAQPTEVGEQIVACDDWTALTVVDVTDTLTSFEAWFKGQFGVSLPSDEVGCVVARCDALAYRLLPYEVARAAMHAELDRLLALKISDPTT